MVLWVQFQVGARSSDTKDFKNKSGPCLHGTYYEPRVAVVLKHCQGCMRVHVCVGFMMGRL